MPKREIRNRKDRQDHTMIKRKKEKRKNNDLQKILNLFLVSLQNTTQKTKDSVKRTLQKWE